MPKGNISYKYEYVGCSTSNLANIIKTVFDNFPKNSYDITNR